MRHLRLGTLYVLTPFPGGRSARQTGSKPGTDLKGYRVGSFSTEGFCRPASDLCIDVGQGIFEGRQGLVGKRSFEKSQGESRYCSHVRIGVRQRGDQMRFSRRVADPAEGESGAKPNPMARVAQSGDDLPGAQGPLVFEHHQASELLVGAEFGVVERRATTSQRSAEQNAETVSHRREGLYPEVRGASPREAIHRRF